MGLMGLSASSPASPDQEIRFPHYQPLVIVLAAAAAGIMIDRFRAPSLAAWTIFGAVALGVWLAFQKRGMNRAGSLAVLAGVAALGGARHHFAWNEVARDDIANFATRKASPVYLEAVALRSPRKLASAERDDMAGPLTDDRPKFRVLLDVKKLRSGKKWRDVSGRINATIAGETTIEAGDRIRLLGTLSAYSPPQNPGEFDLASHFRAQGIHARMRSDSGGIETVEKGSPYGWRRLIDQLKAAGDAVFERYVNPRESDLASAVLLGERERIDGATNEAFMATGTVHVLSISGLHVGTLAIVLIWLTQRTPIPRLVGLASVVFVTGTYMLVADVEPPVVRATVLVWIYCYSKLRRRNALSANSLAAAALVVLTLNPCDLFHVGAQLSFISVAGLIWLHHISQMHRKVVDPLDEIIERRSPALLRLSRFAYRDTMRVFLSGVALWLLTAPLVAARFHILSFSAIFLNCVLWLPMTVGLLAGMGLLFFGLWCPPLALPCAWLCQGCLWILNHAIAWAASLPGSFTWVVGPSDSALAIYYGGIALLVAFPMLIPRKRKAIAAAVIATACLFAAIFLFRGEERQFRCVSLSIGHGLAVVLHLPDGETILYDAGELGSPNRAANVVSSYLWSQGISRIDAAFFSHADVDHFNTFPTLLNKFSCRTVYVSPAMFSKKTGAIGELHEAIEKHGVPIRTLESGEEISFGGRCAVKVLHPSSAGIIAGTNPNSLALAVECEGRRVLLLGDLENPGLAELLKKTPTNCDVLLAPHHGSKASNSPALAAWAKPSWVFLSGDGRWTVPEIDQTYEAVGAKPRHTFLSGALEATLKKDKVTVRGYADENVEP